MLEKNKDLDSIWGITTFFNPLKYSNKYENYKVFRKSSKRQGLNLLVVELAFGDSDFEIKDTDAEKIIKITIDEKNLLWQKEALMNIALKNLPQNCSKVIWIDCDILFENDKWVKDTSDLLNKYKVVQPFTYSVRLKKGLKKIVSSNDLPQKDDEMCKFHGIAYGVARQGYKCLTKYHLHGHIGFVWAARRELFDDIGFYDYSITGSGDTIMANSFFRCKISHFRSDYSKIMLNHIDKWCAIMNKRVKGSVYYTEGVIFHLWHGDHVNRNYTSRHRVFKEFDFNPEKDIRKNSDGVWEWVTDKVGLHDSMRRYFLSRKEDDALGTTIKFSDKIYNIQTKAKLNLNHLIGLIGLIIKRLSPRLYWYLKKILERHGLYPSAKQNQRLSHKKNI